MAYFQYVPNILYRSLQQKGSTFDTAKVTDLFRRGKIRDDIFNVVVYFNKYTIKGDDRPDNVSYEVYGTAEYDWIILLSNNIINIRDEWPLNDSCFEKYLNSKYTSSEREEIRHYETTEIRDSKNRLIRKGGDIVNLETYDSYSYSYFNGSTIVNLDKTSLISVTNYDHEVKLNEEKRKIYVLKPEFVVTVIKDLKEIMEYSDSSQFIDSTTKKTI